MKKILLDTLIVDSFAHTNNIKSIKEFFKDKDIYISLPTLAELNKFNNKRPVINKFLNTFKIKILKHIFPKDEELDNYPFVIDISKHILPTKNNTLYSILNHKESQESLKQLDITKNLFQKNIQEIKVLFDDKKINFDNPISYRTQIKKYFPSKINKRNLKLKLIPFNVFLRIFIIEKFIYREKYDYKLQDFNDISICLNSIYFDSFLTENDSFNVIQSIIRKRNFKDIFQPSFEVMNNKMIKQIIFN